MAKKNTASTSTLEAPAISFPNIVSDPHVFGGRARVLGTNVTVDRLVLMTDQGFSKERIVKLYDNLHAAVIDEALAYHAAGLNPPAQLIPEAVAVHTRARLQSGSTPKIRPGSNSEGADAEQEKPATAPPQDVFAIHRERSKKLMASRKAAAEARERNLVKQEVAAEGEDSILNYTPDNLPAGFLSDPSADSLSDSSSPPPSPTSGMDESVAKIAAQSPIEE